MLRRTLIIAASSTLLSGCFSLHSAQAPVATTYPLTHQQKMQAAHHWDVLAQHQARLIAGNQRLRNQPIYVNGTAGADTPFSEAFDALLTSQLVELGAHVTTRPQPAIQLRYLVQVVEHKDRKDFLRKAEGTWTTLATGIAVATLPYNHWGEPSLALIPAAAAVDLFSGGWTRRSHREVIITTQAIEDHRVVHSSSNIYYINADDDDHYQPSSRSLNMTETW